MKITQIHTNKPQSLSFEIFPPKKEEDLKISTRCLRYSVIVILSTSA